MKVHQAHQESGVKCILLLSHWKFWYLWNFCTKWNFVNINILPSEDIKKLRYCLHILISAEEGVMYWFPVLNHYLTVFICLYANWNIPILNIFPNNSCFVFFTSSQLPSFLLFWIHFHKCSTCQAQYLQLSPTSLYFAPLDCRHTKHEPCFYFIPLTPA